jgi:hypothetical protein
MRPATTRALAAARADAAEALRALRRAATTRPDDSDSSEVLANGVPTRKAPPDSPDALPPRGRYSARGTWSGPSQTRSELKTRGAARREVYFDADWAEQLERLRVALGLPPQRYLGTLLRRATDALSRELASAGKAKKG